MTEYTKEDAILLIMKNMNWNREKALLWMRMDNPLLGGLSADHFFEVGRGHKVMAFIKTAQEENRP